MAGKRRRESSDGAAADYGRYRTPYPNEGVADVLHCSGIGAGTRVLEIGCGTGQLSVLLARQEPTWWPSSSAPTSQHTSMSYVGWLRTDSLILSVDDQSRAGFLNDIRALADSKYGGSVARNFVYEVITART